jgi:hypothetical protein
LRANEVEDFAITERGSAPYCTSESGGTQPFTEVVDQVANALGVSRFEGQGVRGARGRERTVERGRAEVGAKLEEDAEHVAQRQPLVRPVPSPVPKVDPNASRGRP